MRVLSLLAAHGALLFVATLAGEVAQKDQFTQARERFERESNPIDRAKSFPKYGDALISRMRAEASEGNYEQAFKLLETYRNTVKSLHEGLKKSGVNAEKKPGGFKNLQIHLRQGLAKIEELALNVPLDEREAFLSARKELEKVDEALVDMLFPRQPGKTGKESKPGP